MVVLTYSHLANTKWKSDFESLLGQLKNANFKALWKRDIKDQIDTLHALWEKLNLKEQERLTVEYYDFLSQISEWKVLDDAKKYLEKMREWKKIHWDLWVLSRTIHSHVQGLLEESEFVFTEFEQFREYLNSDEQKWTWVRIRQFWYSLVYDSDFSKDECLKLWNIVLWKLDIQTVSTMSVKDFQGLRDFLWAYNLSYEEKVSLAKKIKWLSEPLLLQIHEIAHISTDKPVNPANMDYDAFFGAKASSK